MYSALLGCIVRTCSGQVLTSYTLHIVNAESDKTGRDTDILLSICLPFLFNHNIKRT